MRLNDKIAKAWDKYLTSEHIDFGYDINPEHFSFAVFPPSIAADTPETINITILIDENGFHCRFTCDNFKIQPDYIHEAISEKAKKAIITFFKSTRLTILPKINGTKIKKFFI